MDVTVYMPSQVAADELRQDLPGDVKVDTSTAAMTPFQGLPWLVVLDVPSYSLTEVSPSSPSFMQVLREVRRLGGQVRTPDPWEGT